MPIAYTPFLRTDLIKKESYTYSLPNKSGTIALLDDVPGVELYQFNGYCEFIGNNIRGTVIFSFLNNDLGIYQEGVNSINSATAFGALISYLAKTNYNLATGFILHTNTYKTNKIYGITGSNNFFGVFTYDDEGNDEPYYQDMKGINYADCTLEVEKILG